MLSKVAIVDASSTARNDRLFRFAPLDACGFRTYAYIQMNQAEAAGTRKRQATKEPQVSWIFRNFLYGKDQCLSAVVADALLYATQRLTQ